MNTRLRDAIQALLTEHFRGPLSIAEGRQPVLGSTSIAVPGWRETSIIVPPEDPASPLTHGWWFYVQLTSGMFQRLFVRVGDEYGPWALSIAMGQQVQQDPLQSVLTRKGSQYSGRMREVVQMLGGRNYIIKYDYHWDKTHGIFVNAIDNSWWVVEIGQGVGVKAWPLPIAREFTEEEDAELGLDMPGVPGRDTLMSESTSARTLLSAGGLNNFYTEAWYYTREMGWAFDYTGHHAVNLSILAPNSSRYVNLWRIDITADSSGNPVSASLVGVEHGDMDWGLGFVPKYPHYIEDCGGWTLLSFTGETISQNSSPTNTSTAGSLSAHCPIDAFYRPGSTAPVIARWFVDETGAGTTTVAADWSSDSCYGYISLNVSSSDGNAHSESSWSKTVSEKPNMEFDGSGRPADAIQPWYQSTSGPIHMQTAEEGPPIHTESGSYRKVWTKSYTLYGTKYAGTATEQQKYGECFFKPILDRESFGLHTHQQKTLTVGGGWQKWRWRNIAGGEYLDNVPAYSGGGPRLEQFANPLCSENFGTWHTATTYVAASFPKLITSSAQGYRVRYTYPSCPSGYYETLNWNWADSRAYTCEGPIETGSSGLSTTTSLTKTYIYNSRLGEWKTVRSESSYSSGDLLILTNEDCSNGALQFFAYPDAFSGKGCTYVQPNDGETLYIVGGADAEYPLGDDLLTDRSGWVGVPFP